MPYYACFHDSTFEPDTDRQDYETAMANALTDAQRRALVGAGVAPSGVTPLAPDEAHSVTLCRRGTIRLHDHRGDPLANASYLLVVGDTCTPGMTDDRGWIQWIDTTTVTSATLHVGEHAYAITFASPPSDPVALGQSQLNALGFSAGPKDGNLGGRTEGAILYYQRSRGLPVTGAFDDATIASLKKDHVIDDASEVPSGV